MSILVIAEHDGREIKPATLATLDAAHQIGGEIHLLLLVEKDNNLSQQAAQLDGVSKVLVSESPQFAHFVAEPMADAIIALAKSYTHILAPATTFGKNLLPRVAAPLDVMQISDVMKVVSPDTFERPIYAGNAITTVQSKDPIKVATIRATSFSKVGAASKAAVIETVGGQNMSAPTTFVKMEASLSERPELSAARVVVSGGRGLGSKDNFAIVEKLADCLKAAVGASRAAVDAGFVPNDYQVGQTGKVVAPELYIAVGISGAIQHLAGMKESKVIVAINKDPEAPIFQIADYGLVGDLFEVVPQLTKELCGD